MCIVIALCITYFTVDFELIFKTEQCIDERGRCSQQFTIDDKIFRIVDDATSQRSVRGFAKRLSNEQDFRDCAWLCCSERDVCHAWNYFVTKV
jgi:hypothetical protein